MIVRPLARRLPPAPAQTAEAAPMSAGAPGPTSDQVAAAGQMSAGDRQAMIAGMVDKQAAELKANPKNLEGWERLIRARMVLGQTDQAKAAYRDAAKAFAGSAAELSALRQTATTLGVPGV